MFVEARLIAIEPCVQARKVVALKQRPAGVAASFGKRSRGSLQHHPLAHARQPRRTTRTSSRKNRGKARSAKEKNFDDQSSFPPRDTCRTAKQVNGRNPTIDLRFILCEMAQNALPKTFFRLVFRAHHREVESQFWPPSGDAGHIVPNRTRAVNAIGPGGLTSYCWAKVPGSLG